MMEEEQSGGIDSSAISDRLDEACYDDKIKQLYDKRQPRSPTPFECNQIDCELVQNPGVLRFYQGKLFFNEFINELLQNLQVLQMSLFDISPLLKDSQYLVFAGKVELMLLSNKNSESLSRSLCTFQKGALFNANSAGDVDRGQLRMIADSDVLLATFTNQTVVRINKALRIKECLEVKSVLKTLFPEASKELLVTLENFPLQVLRIREFLFREGQQGSALYVLISGEVELLREREREGRANPELSSLCSLIPPSLLGEECYFEDCPLRKYWAKAKSDAIVIVIKYSDLRSGKASSPLLSFLKSMLVKRQFRPEKQVQPPRGRRKARRAKTRGQPEPLDFQIDFKTDKQRMYEKKLESIKQDIMVPFRKKISIERVRLNKGWTQLIQHIRSQSGEKTPPLEQTLPRATSTGYFVSRLRKKEQPRRLQVQATQRLPGLEMVVPWREVPIRLKKRYSNKRIRLLNKEANYDLILNGALF